MAGKRIDTSGIDDIIGYRLRRAQVAVFARFAQSFAETELKPAEYSTIVLLADNPGLKPSQVAAVLGMQRANFVALAAGLEKRGLIARRVEQEDRRSHTLSLTPSGAAMADDVRRIQERFEAEIVAELGGDAERWQLLALLKKLG